MERKAVGSKISVDTYVRYIYYIHLKVMIVSHCLSAVLDCSFIDSSPWVSTIYISYLNNLIDLT